jgi:ketosteroid isomerase-like protein
MIRWLSLALIAGALASPHAEAQTNAQRSASIARVAAQYDSAWNRRDTAAVNRLLAPGYQYFSSRGDVSARAETLRFLSAPDYKLEFAHRSEGTVTLSGPVAVLSSRWQGRGSYRGEPFNDDQRCGQTWLQNGGNWQLVSEHCVQIAPPPASPSD